MRTHFDSHAKPLDEIRSDPLDRAWQTPERRDQANPRTELDKFLTEPDDLLDEVRRASGENQMQVLE